MKESKVDIVYLWVNSNDIEWQNKREKAFNSLNKTQKKNLSLYANVGGRFRDNGELQFNLRCIEKFFPNHGQIFIVTDNQRPKWLAQSNKITIIDHTEIIEDKKNSIFASSNIESYVHHIPNLSENFFYLNDDIFFGMPVNIDWWFEKKLKYFYDYETHANYSNLQSDLLSPINASIQSKRWFEENYKNYKHVNKTLAHSPRPYKKSFLFKTENEAQFLFKKVRSTNFRSWKKPAVLVDFVPRWLEFHGYAEIIESNPLYIESGSNNIKEELDLLTEKFTKIPFFCINDTCDDAEEDDDRLLSVKHKLHELLPKKSSFEI